MAKEEIGLSDVIGKTGKYQILATLIAAYNEALLGISFIFLQFLFVDVTLYWDWDASSVNKTTFLSVDCKMDDLIRLNSSSNSSNAHSRIIYESQYLTRSLSEKFEFVCERSWLISLTKSLPRIGAVVGSLILGRLCQKFGRRRTCVTLVFGLLLSNLCLLFSPYYAIFAVACVVYGACNVQAYMVFVIQVTELIPDSWRPWYATLIRYGSVFGQIVYSGVAWILKDWFYIHIFNTVAVAFAASVAWYVIDSPAWLIVRGREEDAKKNLMLIVRRNGLNVEESDRKADLWINVMKARQENKKCGEKEKITNLFKNWIIGKYTVCITLAVILPNFSFFGITFNIESFGSGLFQDVMIFAAVSTFGLFVTGLVLRKYSIKNMQIICLLIAATDAVLYVFTYEYRVARTVIISMFRCFLTPVLCTFMVYMAEIFPTSVRVVGTSFVMMSMGVTCLFSPFMKDLAEKTYVYVPFILFAALLMASAFFLTFLPETKNMPLIQTIEELKKKEKKTDPPEP